MDVQQRSEVGWIGACPTHRSDACVQLISDLGRSPNDQSVGRIGRIPGFAQGDASIMDPYGINLLLLNVWFSFPGAERSKSYSCIDEAALVVQCQVRRLRQMLRPVGSPRWT